MKVVILAGGRGTRISEETSVRPKPMVEIGGKPILWHIMKVYSTQGFNEFIICLGFKGYLIKEYFSNYFLHMSDVTFDIINNAMEVHHKHAEPWKVTLVDTGVDIMTGGRIKRIRQYLGRETFMLTYGDGLADVDAGALLAYHRQHGRLATVTTVQSISRYGEVTIGDDQRIQHFKEKPTGEDGWINGGFFVLEPEIIDRIEGDETVFEKHPLESLARDGQLVAYRHRGFWHSMDTLRDRDALEDMWRSNAAPWKLWS